MEIKVSPPVGLENFVVGSNWYTNFYEDSARTKFINATDVSRWLCRITSLLLIEL
ncbi:hypothetical protein JCM10914A_45570 [Paenibacillus sp. JCM 10914]